MGKSSKNRPIPITIRPERKILYKLFAIVDETNKKTTEILEQSLIEYIEKYEADHGEIKIESED